MTTLNEPPSLETLRSLISCLQGDRHSSILFREDNFRYNQSTVSYQQFIGNDYPKVLILLNEQILRNRIRVNGQILPDKELQYSILENIVHHLRDNGDIQPQNFDQWLNDTYPTEQNYHGLLTLVAVRWWLAMNLTYKRGQNQIISDLRALWVPESNLSNRLNVIFAEHPAPLERKDSRVPVEFTAEYMYRVCGLQIAWVDFIDDHLRLTTAKSGNRLVKTLHLFSHVPIARLWYSDRRIATLHTSTVTGEILSTMQLLFPPEDGSTGKFLEKLDSHYELGFVDIYPHDLKAIRRFDQLQHFQERILELKEEVFDKPSFTWKRFFSELSNPEKFLNFWMALVTILVLTLITAIGTVMLTYKAFNP